MKKLFILALTLLLFFGCSSEEKKEKSEASGEGIEITSEENLISNSEIQDKLFDLSYKFPKGTKLSYKLTSVATTNQTLETDTLIEQEVTQTIDYLFDLESLGKVDNNYKLKVHVKSIKLNANFNNEIVSYDSEDPIENKNLKDFTEYAALAKSEYEVTINPQGTIIDVDNVEQILDNYLKIQEVPSITDEDRAKFREQMKAQAVQPLTQQMFKYLPENKIKVNSSWNLKYESDLSVYKLENTATSTLKGIQEIDNDSLAVIKTDLAVIAEGDGNVTQNNVQYSFSKPKITGFADILFNLEGGYIVKSESTSQTEMNLMVSGNDPNMGQQSAKRTDLAVNKNYLELLSID